MKFLEKIVLKVLHKVLCSKEEIIVQGFSPGEEYSEGLNENKYVLEIKDKIELIQQEKIERELARIKDMEDNYDKKYQYMINRLLVIEGIFNSVDSEAFIDGIIKRINEKQLK